MKRFYAFCIAMLLAAPLAIFTPNAVLAKEPAQQAQQKISPEKLKLAKEVVSRIIPGDNFEKIVVLMLRPMQQMMASANPGKAAEINQVFGQLVSEMLKEKDTFINRMAVPYAEIFTEQELKDLIAFMETPTGRKFMAKQPELMARGQRIGAEWGRAIAPKIRQRLKEEAKKRGLKL